MTWTFVAARVAASSGLPMAVKHAVDERGDLGHLGFLQATGGHGRRAEANAGGLEGRAGLERNRVLVAGDVGLIERLLGDLAGELRELGAKVDEHEVVVGAAGVDLVAASGHGGGEGLGVLDDLARCRP